MSSRPLLIAGVLGGIVAGVALCAGVLVLVALDGGALSAQAMAMLMLGVALGVVLDASWLTYAVSHLGKWPEFEREFRAHLEADEAARVAGLSARPPHHVRPRRAPRRPASPGHPPRRRPA
jgi:zinc transporter ZupT